MTEPDPSPARRPVLQRLIRPSSTRSTAALWSKSLLNATLFFAVFMALLPWGAHQLLPLPLYVRGVPGSAAAALLFCAGIGVWGWCLDVFSRRARGTPFPLDAPSRLATSGPFAVIRNPIMAAELAVIWAEAIYFASVGILIYAILITLASHLALLHTEEPELRERFGEAYDAYCRRVPRWIPRFRRDV